MEDRWPGIPTNDSLNVLIKNQVKFQQRLYGPEFLDWDTKQRVEYIKNQMLYLQNELQEVCYELPFFKDWKDYTKMSEEAICVAMAKARLEFVDALHFFINIAIQLGFSADEIMYMYHEKHKENNDRQDRGYDHATNYREGDNDNG